MGRACSTREQKMLVVRPKHIWEYNIKTDLEGMAWERVDCSGQEPLLEFCECGNELLGSIIFPESLLRS
jgi:hypothetical protein